MDGLGSSKNYHFCPALFLANVHSFRRVTNHGELLIVKVKSKNVQPSKILGAVLYIGRKKLGLGLIPETQNGEASTAPFPRELNVEYHRYLLNLPIR